MSHCPFNLIIKGAVDRRAEIFFKTVVVLLVGHLDVMRHFNDDPDTEAVIMVGEIGGSDEEECALWIKDNMTKPVVGFIAGITAPTGKRMGHAGAIIAGGKGTAAEKIQIMEECGITVTKNPAEMGLCMKKALS